jgi:hypothetical protein
MNESRHGTPLSERIIGSAIEVHRPGVERLMPIHEAQLQT